jgi:hypothetical protein
MAWALNERAVVKNTSIGGGILGELNQRHHCIGVMLLVIYNSILAQP